MPRLYREAPVNAIWEGSGNVMCLDVLRALTHDGDAARAVLDALAVSVSRLCEADNASIIRQTGGKYLEVASHGYSPEFKAYISHVVFEPGKETAGGRVLLEGRTVHIFDALADPVDRDTDSDHIDSQDDEISDQAEPGQRPRPRPAQAGKPPGRGHDLSGGLVLRLDAHQSS